MCFRHAEFEAVIGCVQQTVVSIGLAFREEIQDGKKDFITIDIDSS